MTENLPEDSIRSMNMEMLSQCSTESQDAQEKTAHTFRGGQSNLTIFKDLACGNKGARAALQASPCAAPVQPGALSAEPCRWLQSSSSAYLRHGNGHLEARTPVSPALKEAKLFSFQKMDTS